MASGLFWVDFSLIDEDPVNPRGDVGDVTALKLSIARNGQEDPIQVIPQGNGRFWLHEGHRRRKALMELGEQGAKGIERRFGTDRARVISQGVLHLHRKTFDPMAWARYCHRLCWEFKMNRAEIADALGMSPVWVRDHLSFMQLLPAEQQALESGKMTRAEALLRLRTRRAVRDGHEPAADQSHKAAPPAAAVPAQRSRRRPAESHFNAGHKLAHLVADRCASRGADHAARPRIGDVGCGQCWEEEIRVDALAVAAPALAAA